MRYALENEKGVIKGSINRKDHAALLTVQGYIIVMAHLSFSRSAMHDQHIQQTRTNIIKLLRSHGMLLESIISNFPAHACMATSRCRAKAARVPPLMFLKFMCISLQAIGSN